jgi:Arc/MetJ-type ribon-helix-helix transcriptional regulator
MTIEIHTPEIERRVRERIQSGRFQNVDEFLTKALDALSETSGGRMGALEWSQCPAVESVPGRLNGAWVFRDTRMPVSAIFENLEDGATV